MDKIDKKIINLLLRDGRLSYADIAKKVKLSVPSARERVNKLKEQGVIKKFTCEIDYKKVGYPIQALIFVELSVNGSDAYENLMKIPEIVSCSSLAGREDMLLDVRLPDTESLLKLSEKIRATPGIVRTTSSLVLHQYYEQQQLIS